MKKYPVILAALILFTACSSGEDTKSDNKNPAKVPAQDPVPVMTVVEDTDLSSPDSNNKDLSDSDRSISLSQNLLPSSPSEDDQSASENTSAGSENTAAEMSEEENSVGSDSGIFTSSEITDVIKERITGLSYAEGCTVPYEDLRYLQLSYVDFNGQTQTGEMICNKAIAGDLLEIFSELFHNGYRIDKIRLIDEYGADDDKSCDDDNTSCFNYRVVAGSNNLSKHALGLAVDINPFYNPYVTYPDGKIRISPKGSEAYADRSSDFPHKIDENDLAYKLFTSHGFTWGGHWKTLKDYQHFQKVID